MLHPAGFGIKLFKLFLGSIDDFALVIENNRPLAGGAGIYGDDVLRHKKAD